MSRYLTSSADSTETLGWLASIATWWWNSRIVREVMGPMEARTMSAGSGIPTAFSSVKRLEAVEELVKVMASGGSRKRVWRASAAPAGVVLR